MTSLKVLKLAQIAPVEEIEYRSWDAAIEWLWAALLKYARVSWLRQSLTSQFEQRVGLPHVALCLEWALWFCVSSCRKIEFAWSVAWLTKMLSCYRLPCCSSRLMRPDHSSGQRPTLLLFDCLPNLAPLGITAAGRHERARRKPGGQCNQDTRRNLATNGVT